MNNYTNVLKKMYKKDASVPSGMDVKVKGSDMGMSMYRRTSTLEIRRLSRD